MSFPLLLTDNEDPTFDFCPTNETSKTNYPHLTAWVEWADPSAADNSGNPTVDCEPPSGSNFAIGRTTVICTAVDEQGNAVTCLFYVDVEEGKSDRDSLCD